MNNNQGMNSFYSMEIADSCSKLKSIINKSRNMSRNSICSNSKDAKTLSINTLSTKENNIDSHIEQYTSKFLNETLKHQNISKFKTDIITSKKDCDIRKVKKEKHYNFFRTNYISFNNARNFENNNNKNNANIRSKSPIDNKNSPFKKKEQMLKKLHINNKFLMENMTHESFKSIINKENYIKNAYFIRHINLDYCGLNITTYLYFVLYIKTLKSR